LCGYRGTRAGVRHLQEYEQVLVELEEAEEAAGGGAAEAPRRAAAHAQLAQYCTRFLEWLQGGGPQGAEVPAAKRYELERQFRAAQEWLRAVKWDDGVTLAHLQAKSAELNAFAHEQVASVARAAHSDALPQRVAADCVAKAAHSAELPRKASDEHVAKAAHISLIPLRPGTSPKGRDTKPTTKPTAAGDAAVQSGADRLKPSCADCEEGIENRWHCQHLGA
jgi:hypothetical protein